MRARDWLYVIVLYCLSVGCFYYLWAAIEDRAWVFAVACLAVGHLGIYLAISHFRYRRRL